MTEWVRRPVGLLNECQGEAVIEHIGLILMLVAVLVSGGVLFDRDRLEPVVEAVMCPIKRLVDPRADCGAAPTARADSLTLPRQNEVAYPLNGATDAPNEVWARRTPNELPRRFLVPDDQAQGDYEAKLAALDYVVVDDTSLIAAARVFDPEASYASENANPRVDELAKLLRPYGAVQLANADGDASATVGSERINVPHYLSEEWWTTLERWRGPGLLGFPGGTSWGIKSRDGTVDGFAALGAELAMTPDEVAAKVDIAKSASQQASSDPAIQLLLTHSLLATLWISDANRRAKATLKNTEQVVENCGDAYGELAWSSPLFSTSRLLAPSPPSLSFSEEAPYTCHRQLVPWLVAVLTGGRIGWNMGAHASRRGPSGSGGGPSGSQTLPTTQRADADNAPPRLPERASRGGLRGAVTGSVLGQAGADESNPSDDELDHEDHETAVDRDGNEVVFFGDSHAERRGILLRREPIWPLAPVNQARWAEVHAEVAEHLRRTAELRDQDVVSAAAAITRGQPVVARDFQGGRGRRQGTELSREQRQQARPMLQRIEELHHQALGADPETGATSWAEGWTVGVASGDDVWPRVWVELDEEENVKRVAGVDLVMVEPPTHLLTEPRFPPPAAPYLDSRKREEIRRTVREGDEVVRRVLFEDDVPKLVELTNLLRRDPEVAPFIRATHYEANRDGSEALVSEFPSDLAEMLHIDDVSGAANLYAERRAKELETKANGVLAALGVRRYRAVANPEEMTFTSWGEPNWWPLAIQHDPDAELEDAPTPTSPRDQVRTLDDGSEILTYQGIVTRILLNAADREAVLQETRTLSAGLRLGPFEPELMVTVPVPDRASYSDRSITYQLSEDIEEDAISLRELATTNPGLHAAVEKHLARIGKWMRSDLHFQDDGTGSSDNGRTVRFAFDPDRIFVSESNGHVELIWLDPIRAGAGPIAEKKDPKDVGTPEPSRRARRTPKGRIPMHVFDDAIARMNTVLRELGEKTIPPQQIEALKEQMRKLETRPRHRRSVFWYAPNAIVRELVSDDVSKLLGSEAYTLIDFKKKGLLPILPVADDGGFHSLVLEDPWHWANFFPMSAEARQQIRATVEYDRLLTALATQSQPPTFSQRLLGRGGSAAEGRTGLSRRRATHRVRSFTVTDEPAWLNDAAQRTSDGRYWNPTLGEERPDELYGIPRTVFANPHIASAVARMTERLRDDPELRSIVAAPLMEDVPVLDNQGNVVPGLFDREVTLWARWATEKSGSQTEVPGSQVSVGWDRSSGLLRLQTPPVRYEDLPPEWKEEAQQLIADAVQRANDALSRRGSAVETDDSKVVYVTVNAEPRLFNFKVRRNSFGQIESIDRIDWWRDPIRARIARQRRHAGWRDVFELMGNKFSALRDRVAEIIWPPESRASVRTPGRAGQRVSDIVFSEPLVVPDRGDPNRTTISIMASPRTDFDNARGVWGRVNVTHRADGSKRLRLRIRDRRWPLYPAERSELFHRLLQTADVKVGDTVNVVMNDGVTDVAEAPTVLEVQRALEASALTSGHATAVAGDTESGVVRPTESRVEFEVTGEVPQAKPLGVREGIVVHAPSTLGRRAPRPPTIRRQGDETVVLTGERHPPDRIVARWVNGEESRLDPFNPRTQAAVLEDPPGPSVVAWVDGWRGKKAFVVTRADGNDVDGNRVTGIRVDLLAAILDRGARTGDTIRFEFPKEGTFVPEMFQDAKPITNDPESLAQYEAIAREAAEQIDLSVADVNLERTPDSEALVITLGKPIHPRH